MKALQIIVLSVAAACVYGVIHDQITARVCLEYFTVFHPTIIASESPTLLALIWGVAATWWVGLLLGIPLALTARLGKHPKRTPRSLVRPLAILLGTMGIAALAAGLIGYRLAATGRIGVGGSVAEALAPEKHAAFLADLFAHNASYAAGFVGGITLCILTWRCRRGLRAANADAL